VILIPPTGSKAVDTARQDATQVIEPTLFREEIQKTLDTAIDLETIKWNASLTYHSQPEQFLEQQPYKDAKRKGLTSSNNLIALYIQMVTLTGKEPATPE
jgi:hypothetical protein